MRIARILSGSMGVDAPVRVDEQGADILQAKCDTFPFQFLPNATPAPGHEIALAPS